MHLLSSLAQKVLEVLFHQGPTVVSPPASSHGAKTAEAHSEKRTFKPEPRSGNAFVSSD